MQYRKITTGMIEAAYENYKDWKNNDELSYELNKFNLDIPVWRDMSDNTKCAAIEYVYNNRDTIELHSGCVQSWVQATAYFMLSDFASIMIYGGKPELEIFFDDMDFMMEEDILTDSDVMEQMGISTDFTGGF
jgi:hypothetical protein